MSKAEVSVSSLAHCTLHHTGGEDHQPIHEGQELTSMQLVIKVAIYCMNKTTTQVGEESVQAHTGTSEPVETMAALRGEKDNFKPPGK